MPGSVRLPRHSQAIHRQILPSRHEGRATCDAAHHIIRGSIAVVADRCRTPGSLTNTRKRLIAYPLILLALAAGLKLLAWYLEPRMAFYPFAGVQETPRALGLEFRDLSIATRDGERLSAWWIEPRDARVEVVYFHGNGGNLSTWLPILAQIVRRDCAVLAVDYRGYGVSTGVPSETGLYRDADATL